MQKCWLTIGQSPTFPFVRVKVICQPSCDYLQSKQLFDDFKSRFRADHRKKQHRWHTVTNDVLTASDEELIFIDLTYQNGPNLSVGNESSAPPKDFSTRQEKDSKCVKLILLCWWRSVCSDGPGHWWLSAKLDKQKGVDCFFTERTGSGLNKCLLFLTLPGKEQETRLPGFGHGVVGN